MEKKKERVVMSRCYQVTGTFPHHRTFAHALAPVLITFLSLLHNDVPKLPSNLDSIIPSGKLIPPMLWFHDL